MKYAEEEDESDEEDKPSDEGASVDDLDAARDQLANPDGTQFI